MSESTSSTAHYYEPLGAPIVLYRHLPAYQNVDKPEKNPPGKLTDDRTLISAKFGNPMIDTINSIYPPQPWGRIPPFDKSAWRLISVDAKILHTQLLNAARARTRYHVNGLLESIVKQQIVKKERRRKILNEAKIRRRKRTLIVMMTRAPQRIISTFNKTHPEYSVDLQSPYVKNRVDSKSKLLPLLPTVFARTMRRDLRLSSPKDGYCSPFPTSMIRYCLNQCEESEGLPQVAMKQKPKITNETEIQKNGQGFNDPEPANNHPNEDNTNDADESLSESNELMENDETDHYEGISTITKSVKLKIRGQAPFRSKVVPPMPAPRGPSFSPQYYGNCLLVIPCPRDLDEVKCDKCYSRFLVHPVGHCVTITRLDLPQSEYTPTSFLKPSADVGDQVLQISPCFDIDNPTSSSKRLYLEGSQSWRFAVRTSSSIVVLSFESSGVHLGGLCTVSFNLKHMKRIDLPIFGDASYIPLRLAARVDNPHPFVSRYSTFATISSIGLNSPYDESKTNVIHHIIDCVGDGDNAQIKRHEMKRLHSISLIEFSGLHPMVLWSAARSTGISPYIGGPRHSEMPTMGYGHSLYSIDLRSNDAALTWSPSRAEFSLERVHSISGVFPDDYNPHYLYVSSISAGGKTWKIDCRMNSRYIYSWTLPGLCDDYKPTGSNAGVYGFGTIFTKPVLGAATACFPQPVPLLTVSRSPGSFGFHVLQEPTALPRFATQCLEIPACPDGGAAYQQSFTKSSTFKFADSSSGSFTTGITAFYTPILSIMDDMSIDDLGYGLNQPNNCLCVITSSSVGDIFGYTLIQNENDVIKRSVTFEDSPAGTSAVPVPPHASLCDEAAHVERFHWHLSNKYPATYNAVLKQCAEKKSHCRPFTSIERQRLNNFTSYHGTSASEHLNMHHHTFNETYLGDGAHPPATLKLPANFAASKSLEVSRHFSIQANIKTADDITGSKDSGRCDLKDEGIIYLLSLWDKSSTI